MKNKKGGFEMSFGMIFSILLIIAFVFVSFYVIKVFLGIKNCGELGRFYEELQASIENAKKSPETSQKITSLLPTSIEYMCIVDLNESGKGQRSGLYEELLLVNRNFAVYPKTKCKGLGGIDLKYANIAGITQSENPFCIKVEGGKISLRVEKTLYEKLVRISRA